MARIRGRNTSPELALRRQLWGRGLRYRLQAAVPVGRPDFVFVKPRVAVFVDGCFWHGCPTHYVRPRTRVEFWADKRAANFERDRRHTLALAAAGWVVIRIWEHEIEEDPSGVADRIAAVVGCRLAQVEWRQVVLVEALDGIDTERRTVKDLIDTEFCEVTEGRRNSRSGPRARRRKPFGSRRSAPREQDLGSDDLG